VVGDRTYAFVGLERTGGVMVYDITDPRAPFFVSYGSNSDVLGNAEDGTAGDVAPEGIRFVTAEESPTGAPLLLVANEVSGSTTVYAIEAAGE
ncbi:MAG: choice-of-anchor I domain-containing protein, partial [Caldilineaceae bacterium]